MGKMNAIDLERKEFRRRVKQCLPCKVNGSCHCVTNLDDHDVKTRGCHWHCNEHGREYFSNQYDLVGKCGRVWSFGRMCDPQLVDGRVMSRKWKKNFHTYVPRRGTIPDTFMRRIQKEGPLFGKETGRDKQPAVNLKKAGYLYTTKNGYALTEKGLNYLK